MIQSIRTSLQVVILCSLNTKLLEILTKTKKADSQTVDSLVDVDSILIIDTYSAYEGTKDSDPDNDLSVEPTDVPTDDVVVDNQPTHGEMTISYAPETSCRRSAREK